MSKPFAAVAVRSRALVAALALAAVPMAARAVEVPATAVTEDTVMVAWLDVSGVNAKDVTEELAKLQAKMAQASAMSPKQKEQADKIVKGLLAAREQFLAAGGQGILVGVSQPAKEGDKPEAYLLLKSKAGADRAKLEKVIHGLADLAKDQNQAATAILSAKVEKYGASTEWHAITADELAAPPLNGNAKEAAVFNDAIKAAGKGTLELCFRMSGKMKQDLKAQVEAQGKDPQPGPMAMMGGVMQPLVNLDTVTLIGTGAKGSRNVVLAAHFADEQSAKDFTGATNGVVEMVKGMMGMQLAQMSKYGVDQKNAQDVMGSFAIKDAGKDAVLKLDDAFFAKAETFGEQMQAAQEKMKAGMKGRGGPAIEAGDEDDAKALDEAEKSAK